MGGKPLTETTAKRVARVRLTLTEHTVEALEPAGKSWLAWDDALTGFGVRVQPTGVKSFIVNYRAGDGGRKAPNKRVVIGRHGKMSTERARRLARRMLDEVAHGGDPAGGRDRTPGMPVLEQAFEEYMAANPGRTAGTNKVYREGYRRHLGDWSDRPLDAISRRDVEARFNRLTVDRGWAAANHTISLLRSVYRRPCVDLEGLRNPVDLWLAGGGRFNRKLRRRISAPSDVLPRWRAGIEAEVGNPMMRDAFLFGMYTGMRVDEVLCLRWDRVDLARLVFRVDETKTGVPLELPVTRQLGAVLERRWEESGPFGGGWVFPSSTSRTGHLPHLKQFYRRIGKTGGAKFWYHGLRNAFITVAERDLLLPRSLTKRLVNHARSGDITEGYAADWTIGQLREPAQRIADRIEALAKPGKTDAAQNLAVAACAQVTATGISVSRLYSRESRMRCSTAARPAVPVRCGPPGKQRADPA